MTIENCFECKRPIPELVGVRWFEIRSFGYSSVGIKGERVSIFKVEAPPLKKNICYQCFEKIAPKEYYQGS